MNGNGASGVSGARLFSLSGKIWEMSVSSLAYPKTTIAIWDSLGYPRVDRHDGGNALTPWSLIMLP